MRQTKKIECVCVCISVNCFQSKRNWFGYQSDRKKEKKTLVCERLSNDDSVAIYGLYMKIGPSSS